MCVVLGYKIPRWDAGERFRRLVGVHLVVVWIDGIIVQIFCYWKC